MIGGLIIVLSRLVVEFCSRFMFSLWWFGVEFLIISDCDSGSIGFLVMFISV